MKVTGKGTDVGTRRLPGNPDMVRVARSLIVSVLLVISLGGCGGNSAYAECVRENQDVADESLNPEGMIKNMCERHCAVNYWTGENDCSRSPR